MVSTLRRLLLVAVLCAAAISAGAVWLVSVVETGCRELEEAACVDGVRIDLSTLCEKDSPAEEERMTATPEITRERIIEVRKKYRNLLFRRHPYYTGSGTWSLWDENGKFIRRVGINVYVTKKVDQSTLPVEDRIPDCLDGVPVQIVEQAPAVPAVEDTNQEEANGRN